MNRIIGPALLASNIILLLGCSPVDESTRDMSYVAGDTALPAPARGLSLIDTQPLSGRLYELRLRSPAMASETRVRVLLPLSYDAQRSPAYPVFYLLHGCCSNGLGYTSWTDEFGLEAFSTAMDAVFVMPEGGNGGLYSDWYNAGLGGPPRWETYHVRELMPWVEQNYRVRRDRTGRAVFGISMGGHGSFAYAAKYPHYFGSAAAISPSIDSNTFLGSRVLDEGALLDGGAADDIWGPRRTEEVRWRGHNPVDLAENLAGTNLFLRSGNGRREGSLLFLDIAEAAVHEMAVNMHLELNRLGVPHRFDDYGFGTHTPDFWLPGIQQIIPQQLALARGPDAPIRRFSYRSIEPEFSVFGWHVRLERDVIEFARLGQVSTQGFTLSGSGLAAVTTARWYQPNTEHDVRIDGQSMRQMSDAQGRLRFLLDLGPSRSIQEFRLGSPGGYLRTVDVEIRPVPL